MGSLELSSRENWQTGSGQESSSKEKRFIEIFQEEFKGTEYVIHEKPKDFKDIYSKIILSEEVRTSIYSPPKIGEWGITPDFDIENTKTGKKLYGDNKKQDGWVEGLPSSAGRGNVHERLGRYFTPGLRKALGDKANLGNDILPFWIVFEGNITRDPKRVREITCWFDGYPDHFFMWADSSDSSLLIAHFNEKLKPLLV